MCFDKHVLTGDRFLLTFLQAGTMDWKASGKQLVNEEQQAAAKAAAEKAKKLRHKLNKQPMQQDHIVGQNSSLQRSPDAEALDAHNDASQYVLNTTPLRPAKVFQLLHLLLAAKTHIPPRGRCQTHHHTKLLIHW